MWNTSSPFCCVVVSCVPFPFTLSLHLFRKHLHHEHFTMIIIIFIIIFFTIIIITTTSKCVVCCTLRVKRKESSVTVASALMLLYFVSFARCFFALCYNTLDTLVKFSLLLVVLSRRIVSRESCLRSWLYFFFFSTNKQIYAHMRVL